MRKALEYTLHDTMTGKHKARYGNYSAKRHGNIIAVELFDNRIAIIDLTREMVELSHAGYYTHTTATALNSIEKKFKGIGFAVNRLD